LMELCNHADDFGERIYPSVAYVAWATDYDRRTVQRALKELRETGVIEVVAEATRHDPTEYRVVLERAPEKPSFERPERGPEAARRRGGAVSPLESRGGAERSQGRQRTHLGAAENASRGGAGAAQTIRETSGEPSGEPSGDARELPEMLLDAWEVDVMRVLLALPRTTGSPVPTVGALRRVRSDFPELDLLVVARELDFWARHGNGSRRQIKSVMGTFRNFAKRAEEDRQRRTASSSPSAAVPSVATRQDEGWERAPWT
jgi:DNA-binding transcriptional ArsR family regulator